MQPTTHIDADQRNGNLHIRLNGHFTPDVAAKLTMIMAKTYQGKGNIFIHTEQITNVAQESRYAFHNLLDMSGLPQDNVYLTGKTGFEICHDTGKVIVHKETGHSHNGCGKCKNCTCRKRKAA
ncbi:MAG TPA: hypothetical protein ENK89_06465 [Desulfobulbaceae bacterium]|nr:hypothetical protein [Desulfobulbaceae bacterium]